MVRRHHPRSSSFIAIIDQDHWEIETLSLQFAQLLSLKLPQTPELRQQRLDLLNLLAWRLVRHDFSEDIVMRPAFEQYLGKEGKAMGDHDRDDHEKARKELLRLYGAFENLPLSDLTGLAVLQNQYAALIADLTEHMRIESGNDLHRLEAMMTPAQSDELGRFYLETLVVKPDLKICGKRVWIDVGEYLNTSLQELRSLSAVVFVEKRRSTSSKL